jgi:hypothetical protein
MRYIGYIFVYFGLYLLYSATFGQNSPFGFSFKIALLFGVPGLLLAGFGGYLIEKDDDSKQGERNENAKKIINDLMENKKVQNFALYLRPFEFDSKFVRNDSANNMFSIEAYYRPGFDPIERSLNDALEDTFPLVGLGMPEEGIKGIAIGGSYENWKEVINIAIKESEMILVIPASSKGTVWEIGKILESNKLEETMFIMPPNNHNISYEGQEDIINIWEAAATKLSGTYNLSLPDYHKDGAIFGYDKNKQLVGVVKASDFEPRSLAKRINKYISLLEKHSIK